MEVVADILLISGAFGAGFYCFILSRKLSSLKGLESGVGGAISKLSRQVDEMKLTLENARSDVEKLMSSLNESSQRAERAAHDLRGLLDHIPSSPDNPGPSHVRQSSETEQPSFRRRRPSFTLEVEK